MIGVRIFAGAVAGALLAAGVLAVPAIGATDKLPVRISRHVMPLRGLGTFTPASADPRLAAVFARGGLDTSDFHFTPAETRRDNRAVTVAVRARSNRNVATNTQLAAVVSAPTVGMAPIAYNLGVAVGWKRFAVAGDVSHIDLAAKPGSRETADVAVSYTGQRFSGRVKAAAERPIGDAPRLLSDLPTYSLDLGGSYSLTRNLDVTAGLRYRSDRERLARVEDDRRDSQAVYVGTAFRF